VAKQVSDPCIGRSIRRQPLCEQSDKLSKGRSLAHPTLQERENEPENLRTTHAVARRKTGPRYSSRSAQAAFRQGQYLSIVKSFETEWPAG
jgi:hypothetical protein